jgi:GH24 family phage-related lysozyme (muramidase)
MRFRIKTGSKFFRDMASSYTLGEFISYLKKVEGFKNKVGDTFYPYDSPEGGLKTIGYGYKIRTLSEQSAFEKGGMSILEVEQTLENEAHMSLVKAKNYCIAKGTQWKKVDNRLKYALADYCFNIGNLKGFPTTSNCLMNNDVKGAIEEDPTREGFKHYERVYKDTKGNRKPLGRNKEFYKEFLEPYIG